MEKPRKITQYRERLDRTLASPSLTDEEALKTLVKNQLIRSKEHGNEGCQFLTSSFSSLTFVVGHQSCTTNILRQCKQICDHLIMFRFMAPAGCNENEVGEKTAEVSNLLDMLRSASLVNDKGLKTCETTTQPEWKVCYRICIMFFKSCFVL